MRKSVKAKFENTDAAEYALNAVRALRAGAKCELHAIPDAGSIYNYSGVIPQSSYTSNTVTNLFVPTFPENSTLSDIENHRAAMLEVTCPPSELGHVTQTLIKYGGMIGK
ncbi:MAG: hypothetical protein J1E39_04840 [Eubacterium sp.]|nr:hypothetical protein [Eubacterium sp.]